MTDICGRLIGGGVHGGLAGRTGLSARGGATRVPGQAWPPAPQPSPLLLSRCCGLPDRYCAACNTAGKSGSKTVPVQCTDGKGKAQAGERMGAPQRPKRKVGSSTLPPTTSSEQATWPVTCQNMAFRVHAAVAAHARLYRS